MAVLEKLTHFDNDGSDDGREGFDFRVLENLVNHLCALLYYTLYTLSRPGDLMTAQTQRSTLAEASAPRDRTTRRPCVCVSRASIPFLSLPSLPVIDKLDLLLVFQSQSQCFYL